MIQVKIFLFYVDLIGKRVLPIILGCLYVFVGTYNKQKSTLKTCLNIKCVNVLDLAVYYVLFFAEFKFR